MLMGPGWATIEAVSDTGRLERVYNLEIEDDHTYFVGCDEWGFRVLLTGKLPFSQWAQIFRDPMTTAAAIDRLVRHSVIVELNVASYRLETAQSARTPKDPAPKE